MGCEAHPDSDDRTFMCEGGVEVVFSPYFVAENGVEYPHWNGAKAFGPRGEHAETVVLPTERSMLTQLPGEVEEITVAFEGLRRVS